jgi:hypothetical protein
MQGTPFTSLLFRLPSLLNGRPLIFQPFIFLTLHLPDLHLPAVHL